MKHIKVSNPHNEAAAYEEYLIFLSDKCGAGELHRIIQTGASVILLTLIDKWDRNIETPDNITQLGSITDYILSRYGTKHEYWNILYYYINLSFIYNRLKQRTSTTEKPKVRYI